MSAFLSKTEDMAGFTAIFLIGIGIVQIILGGYVSKSVALTANGIDCVGDGFVSTVVWVGLRLFRRPADEKFHYGYYKLENLTSIVAAAVMVILALYIGYRSYLQLVDPHEIEVPLLGAIIALIAGIIAVILGSIKYSKSKKSMLHSAKLEAFNTVKDGTVSFLTVIALVISSYGYPIVDAIVGFVISVIILGIGFAAMKEASYVLIDACDRSCLNAREVIRTVISSIKGVKASHVVRLRRSGPVYQGEMVIEVPRETTISEVDKIKSEIHKLLKEKIPDMEPLTITAIPYKMNDKKIKKGE